ncbi:MAG: hypothetical protein E7273_07980 [Pseudobutyrivibrio ruminis]|nr:hypothetical protein [Pseudobutyrivibrio ruminis]
MRLLIIGNGFDKMHNLPTGYNDFLDFIKELYMAINVPMDKMMAQIQIAQRQKDILALMEDIDNGITNIQITHAMYMMSQLATDELTEFYQESAKCFWIEYFFQVRNKIGDKWMNIEEEIERVVKDLFSDSYKDELINYSNIPNKAVAEFFVKNYRRNLYSRDFEKIFYGEFILLTSLINRYMGYVDKLNVRPLKIFGDMNYDKVLTFNYTHTYERLYNNDDSS